MPLRDLEELRRLIAAHHPAVFVADEEPERIDVLLEELARESGQNLLTWTPGRGLSARDSPHPIADTGRLSSCLSFIASANRPHIYHLMHADEIFESAPMSARLQEILQSHRGHGGIVIFSGRTSFVPDAWISSIPVLEMTPPSRKEYFEFVQHLVRELRGRMRVEMGMSAEDVGRLLAMLHGMSFSLVRRVLTEAIVLDGRLDAEDLEHVLQTKREVISKSGVLEYFPADARLAEVAGLENLKRWFQTRGRAFLEPERAQAFGLDPARGVLLLGVQGCGKSLAAKAIAAKWSLPLVRLDPGRLYDKYMGESEKNLRRALRTCEEMAPLVLWIDEIEKAFGPANDQDGGASQRIFGTLLTWLQEKREPVFVVATSNDISRLPPELLRKGRFDEIFFVDLPRVDIREAILSVHLKKRQRDPASFDLGALASRTEGFSGAELEQVVVGALYAAFAAEEDLSSAHLLEEAEKTRPLSVTMSEPIERLRRWALHRTVMADDA